MGSHCILSTAILIDIANYTSVMQTIFCVEQSIEGSEFYVGFFQGGSVMGCWAMGSSTHQSHEVQLLSRYVALWAPDHITSPPHNEGGICEQCYTCVVGQIITPSSLPASGQVCRHLIGPQLAINKSKPDHHCCFVRVKRKCTYECNNVIQQWNRFHFLYVLELFSNFESHINMCYR